MPLERSLQNLRVLLRANSITGEIRLRHILARTSLQMLSGLIASFGLLMIDIAAFFSLESMYGPVRAAMGIGIGNIVLAGLLVLISSRLRPGRELALAKEIQDMALGVVIHDAKEIQSHVSGLLHNPLDAALTGALGHLTAILIKQLRSRKE